MNELALFAGAGGGILGGKLLGWRTVCAVEWEPYPASVLCARQNDGVLPPFPVWDDVQTFDGKPWQGIVDVVSGGFPCQDISAAGKGEGIDGKRSGMWKHFARIIREVEPTFAFIENSPMLRTRGLEVVLEDLAKMGYDAQWGCYSAAEVKANHKRDRMWIVARKVDNTNLSYGKRGWLSGGVQKEYSDANCSSTYLADTQNEGNVWRKWIMEFAKQEYNNRGGTIDGSGEWWKAEPNVGRVVDGVAARVDRLKAIGNGQVPLCAAVAFKQLKDRFND